VIIPGSKNTRADMDWLRRNGWEECIQAHVRNQGCLLGICGGYQILGQTIQDPQGLEGDPGTTLGLGLLPVNTILQAPKTTTLSCFAWDNIPAEGYEIHMGETTRVAGSPLFRVPTRNRRPCTDFDGCLADNGRVAGTYMHGLFDTLPILEKWLTMAGIRDIDLSGVPSREENYAQLKDHFEHHVNLGQIIDATGIGTGRQISA
jgi:adenosylcobyric acid synthase